MGLNTALYTGLTGLKAHSTMLSVTGNNIANVNTTGFKRSRAEFETLISQTLASGTAPSDEWGGSNPTQVGLGTRVEAVRDFTDGALGSTGKSTDMAVEGNGFFVVNAGGEQRYTRAGNFSLDSDFNLVNPNGALVQGWTADEGFQIEQGQLETLNIPVGALTIAEATENVRFAGNLNAAGDLATQGTLLTTNTLFADPGATVFADGTTDLVDVFNGAGDSLFDLGDVITISGAMRGGAALPDRTFEVNNANTTDSHAFGTTLNELMQFINDALGIADDIDGGVSIDDGVIQIEGNAGTANRLRLRDADLVVNADDVPSMPLAFAEQAEAVGESVRTSFIAYDSLGNEMMLDLTIAFEAKDNAGTTWRYHVQSDDHQALSRHMGSGLMTFNNQGAFVGATQESFNILRDGTGAATPQAINLNFTGDNQNLSALAGTQSEVASIDRDGSALGTLTDFDIGQDGVINGIFSNGLRRNLGQVAMATFTNNQGLEEVGGNLYRATANSGAAGISNPGTGGTGRLIGRALEMSNVDLAHEFIDMVRATTGFSANSRVLTTSDRLLQELMNIGR